jgi:PEP-CTERM motif
MKTETSGGKQGIGKNQTLAGTQHVLFAQTPDPNITVGVVSSAEPSTLTLLAAGVAGMAARRARRVQTK